MTETETTEAEAPELAEGIEELATTLAASLFENMAMIVDQQIDIRHSDFTTDSNPPSGADEVHISFRFTFRREDETRFACLLLPLEQTVTGACSMMMMPLDQATEICDSGTLDSTMKDAILEIGNMLSNAFTKVFAEAGRKETVSFHGCQGLRADAMAWIPVNNPEGWGILEGRGTWEGLGDFAFALAIPAE